MSSIPFWFGAGHVGVRHRTLEEREHTHDQNSRRGQLEPKVTKKGVRQLKVHAVGPLQGPRGVSLYKVWTTT